MIKKIFPIFVIAIILSLVTACSSDDNNNIDPVVTEANVLLIKSDKGNTSTGTIYKKYIKVVRRTILLIAIWGKR